MLKPTLSVCVGGRHLNLGQGRSLKVHSNAAAVRGALHPSRVACRVCEAGAEGDRIARGAAVHRVNRLPVRAVAAGVGRRHGSSGQCHGQDRDGFTGAEGEGEVVPRLRTVRCSIRRSKRDTAQRRRGRVNGDLAVVGCIANRRTVIACKILIIQREAQLLTES